MSRIIRADARATARQWHVGQWQLEERILRANVCATATGPLNVAFKALQVGVAR